MHNAPSLPELQQVFAAAMLGADSAPLADWVAGAGLAPDARVQIYRNLVFNNHAAALRTAYPAVLKLVGEEFFDAAAARYGRDFPSHSGNLQDYGAGFPMCLAQMPEAAGLAYLPDVARLEWVRQESYLAAEANPLPPSALGEWRDLEPETLRFVLHPSLRLVASAHPVWDIWQFCQEAAPGHLDLAGGPQAVLVWRETGQIAMQQTDAGRRSFITALLLHMSLAEAYESAVQTTSDFDLSASLQWLFQAGLVTDFFSN